MNKCVGVRFKPNGKIYDFDCGAFVLRKGDQVIVETRQGLGFGIVETPPAPQRARNSSKALKKVYRLADDEDRQQLAENLDSEKQAHAFCQQCIEQLKLPMNLFSVEKSFDGRKITFFFTSDGRVDFRQLVKMLVKKLSIRVEMRQVGIRHQAKICGGIGRCGRQVCCSLFMDRFGPVSIRMAKEQGLSLNPAKISGLCGRLMCCLTFEHDVYMKLKKGYPKVGKMIRTPHGLGRVIRHNVLGGKISIKLEDNREMEIGLPDIIKE